MTTWTHTIAESCPWPERRGLRCRLAEPPPERPGAAAYPWGGLGVREVVVLLDGDPLGGGGDDWTCVLYADDLTPIAEGDLP